MEKFTENAQKEKFPGPYFLGKFKEYSNKRGFSILWHNTDIRSRTTEPGIYIRLIRPDNHIKEEKFFPFGEENQAEKEYQKMVKKIQEWDKI